MAFVTAICQGTPTGAAVACRGEVPVWLIGLVAALVGLLGYGVTTGMGMVVRFKLIHAPEGFVNPMLTAIMSKAAAGVVCMPMLLFLSHARSRPVVA